MELVGVAAQEAFLPDGDVFFTNVISYDGDDNDGDDDDDLHQPT